MFKLFMKFFNKQYKFNSLLSDKLVKSCINFKYTVYNNPYDVIRIELYYHSENGKYVSSVIRTDPSENSNKKINIINQTYDNFVDASNSFHKLCKQYHDDVYEGKMSCLDNEQ